MKEQQVESGARKMSTFFQQAHITVMKNRKLVQSKVFDGEAKKAFFEKARIRIMEHHRRKAEAEAAASSSSTASPAKPNFNLMSELPKSSSPAADEEEDFKEKHNSDDQIKPVWVKPPWAQRSEIGVVEDKNCCVYDSEDPVVPGYIKEYCTLALDKYNNEKGTNYRFVRPLRAHEVGKTGTTRDSIFTLTFRASQSDSDSDSETFRTKITSGLRFSKGKWLFGEEVQQVSRVLGYQQFW